MTAGHMSENTVPVFCTSCDPNPVYARCLFCILIKSTGLPGMGRKKVLLKAVVS